MNFNRRARDVIHRCCMTSIISILDLRTSLRTTVCIFFLSVMPYYILADPQIEYGVRNRLLAAKRATNMTKTCNATRQAEFFTSRYIINILFECTRPKRILQKKKRERNVCGVILVYGIYRQNRFPNETGKAAAKANILTYY